MNRSSHIQPWKTANEELTQQAGGSGPARINESFVAETELGGSNQSKTTQEAAYASAPRKAGNSSSELFSECSLLSDEPLRRKS
jgi:hypothetical protein